MAGSPIFRSRLLGWIFIHFGRLISICRLYSVLWFSVQNIVFVGILSLLRDSLVIIGERGGLSKSTGKGQVYP